jgi:ribonuclease Z
MTGTIELSLINGVSGDPAVYSCATQSSDAVLFDAGSLEDISNRELLKVRVVAISHTHVDHFIGFDRIIRVNIPHFRTIEVVGPKNIQLNVMSKLRAYTWNLLEPGQINYIVHEVSEGSCVRTFRISNDQNFEPQEISTQNQVGQRVKIPLQNISSFELYASILDHGTPVLAFCKQLPDSLTVDKPSLQKSGFVAGPWIAELQRNAIENRLEGSIDINGQSVPSQQLAKTLLRPRKGDNVLYVTDILFNNKNLRAIETLCNGNGIGHFVCEANYRNEDRQKAFSKSHLTTKQAALIAATIKAKEFIIFHVSNIYAGSIEISSAESSSLFETYSLLSAEALHSACKDEFPS